MREISRHNVREIDLGLERVSRVARALDITRPAPTSVLVAGTNGKGSTTLAAETLLRAAGLRVGATLSPHIQRFNERVRIDGVEADDAALCAGFARIEAVRRELDLPLTYFEFATLVSLLLFRESGVEVALLEIGLGGRLDAYNLVDAQFSVITSIGLDHQEFLGDTHDAIAREKAGVFRAGQVAVLGPELPPAVAEAGRSVGVASRTLGVDFTLQAGPGGAPELVSHGHRIALPGGPLVPSNLALAAELCANIGTALGFDLFERVDVATRLARLRVPGRFELRYHGGRCWRFDVGHNPLAADWLLQALRRLHPEARVVAVFGQLQGKDSTEIVLRLRHRVAAWIVTGTHGWRARDAEDLAAEVRSIVPCESAPDVQDALARARAQTGPRDVILVFGSFNIVEQALQIHHAERAKPVDE